MQPRDRPGAPLKGEAKRPAHTLAASDKTAGLPPGCAEGRVADGYRLVDASGLPLASPFCLHFHQELVRHRLPMLLSHMLKGNHLEGVPLHLLL